MRKIVLLSFTLLSVLVLTTTANAQAKKTAKKKQTVEIKAISAPNAEVESLQRPTNEKNNPQEKSRGDVFGADYSDIIVDNWTGWYLDIYVDGSYRGTLEPYGKKTTWAVPGTTKLYAKASFNDGSYLYWSSTTRTGYEYTWKLVK